MELTFTGALHELVNAMPAFRDEETLLAIRAAIDAEHDRRNPTYNHDDDYVAIDDQQ